jgi:hypothetical protein
MKMSSAKKWRLALNISAVVGPLVAIGAACIAYGATQNSTNEQYVALAINILREGQRSPSDAALREWAADLLNAYSGKVPLPEKVLKELRSGQLTLPAVVGCGAITDSPDTIHGKGKATPP